MVIQGRELSNKLVQKWLDHNDILMYLTHNEDKSVVSERFSTALQGKIYKRW